MATTADCATFYSRKGELVVSEFVDSTNDMWREQLKFVGSFIGSVCVSAQTTICCGSDWYLFICWAILL